MCAPMAAQGKEHDHDDWNPGAESVGGERLEQSRPSQILQVSAEDSRCPQNQQHAENADVRILKDRGLHQLIQNHAQKR